MAAHLRLVIVPEESFMFRCEFYERCKNSSLLFSTFLLSALLFSSPLLSNLSLTHHFFFLSPSKIIKFLKLSVEVFTKFHVFPLCLLRSALLAPLPPRLVFVEPKAFFIPLCHPDASSQAQAAARGKPDDAAETREVYCR